MPFKLQNPWKENLKDTPKESLNWRLWYGVFGETSCIAIADCFD